MNKPDNGILIVPRIDRLEDGSYVTLVRRLTFANGYIVSKELLSKNGEWIVTLEDGEYLEYPEECFIESFTFGTQDIVGNRWLSNVSATDRIEISGSEIR